MMQLVIASIFLTAILPRNENKFMEIQFCKSSGLETTKESTRVSQPHRNISMLNHKKFVIRAAERVPADSKL